MSKPRRMPKDHPSLAEAKRVLEVEAAAIMSIIDHLDNTFVEVVERINACTGRVVTMGLGKSGIICKKISATLASTGTPSFFLHPAEANHGDLGMVVRGDVALAMALLRRKGFKEEDFAFLHPGGKLGKRYLRVHDLMHGGEQLPVVRLGSSMRDAIYEMSKKRFGITAVVDDDGVLKGAISDGDLRRLLEKDETIVGKTAGVSMTENPVTINGTKLASAALQIMEERKITSLFITDESGRVE